MKKVVRILLAILMVMCLALSITACKSDCDKGNHKWDEGTVTTPATCTAKGVKTYKCTVCETTKTEDIDKVAHTPVDASVPATCTADGVTGATKCSVCGTSIAAGTKVNKLGHVAPATFTPCADDDTKHEGLCTRGCGEKVVEAHRPNEDGTVCLDCNKTLGTVVTPHDHDYEGQAWQTDAATNKHYQVCKVSGCDARNEHAISMGNWTVVDGKHQQSCTVTGCGVTPTTHDAAFGTTFVTTDDTNHYKQCADCTLTTEVGEHNHTASIIDGNSDKHAVACSVCGKQYDDADHTPVKVDGTPATCTTAGKGEGSKCSVCDYVITEGATIPALKHDYTDVDWTISATDANKHERACTREGCGYVDMQDHTWDTEWANDSTKHWIDCTKCAAVKDEDDHDFGDEGRDLTCNICDEVNPSSEFNYVVVYTLDGERVRVGYIKLADAIDAIGANENVLSATISVRGDGEGKTLNGLGVVIPENHTITIDLNGATYVVASDPVGSTGTETNGFQILKNSNVTIKDGTIKSATGSGVKLLIQNYANLTLDGVILDGRNLDAVSSGHNYTLSNNCGTVTIENKSRIIAREENGVALDVWYNMGNRYPQGVNVTVDDTCRITGVIEYGSAQANVADLATKAVLTLPAGNYTIRYSGNITDCTATGITIDGEALTHKLSNTLTHELVGDVHKHYATCSLCSSKIYSNCTWDKGVVTVAANCVTPKVTTFTCTACGYANDVTGDVDNTKHDFDATIKDNVTVTKAATCTEKGTMTVKCSRCDAEKTGVEIPMVAHQYDTTKYVFVSATEHAHKCANCDDYKDATTHTYTANHCETCDGNITQKQIVTLMADLSKNGEKYDPLVSSGSTFVLTGVYNGLYNNITSNYQLVDDEGNHLIVVYQLDVADLIVGDKITVTGKITFFTDKNGDRIQFGNDNSHEVVERGQSSVTVNVVDDEGNATDKANYTLTGVTSGKATNKSTVTLTVNVDSDWIINKVSADIVTVDYDAATKTYSLTVKGDTVITIQVKEDDGKRTYDTVVTYDVSKRGENDNISGIKYDTISIALTGGAFNGDQLRLYANQTMTITAPADISKIVFTTVSGSKSGANLTIASGGGEISGSGTVFTWTGSGKEIKFDCKTQTQILSIEVTYSVTVECKHIDAEEVTAKAAACGEIGFKVDGIYCSTCKHFTTNGWDKLADSQIIPALDHKYVSVDATTGTCLVNAVAAHYTCENCDKLFIDENDAKKVVTLAAITGDKGDHSYGAWSNVTGTATHSKTCSVCNNTVTEDCASETYLNSTTHHWKICDVCTVKFGETTHTGDTSCVCGALKLTYKVVDSEGATVADAINTTSTIVTGYAKAGENVSVTIVAADTHKVNTVASDGAFTAQGSNVYTGKLAANGEIVVTVEEKASAMFKELILNGIDAENVELTIGGSNIEANQTLNANDVIDITVLYDADDYDLTVVVNQGNDSTIDMTDGQGSYTCLGLGEVTITVTLTAKASVTVTGNGTVTVNGVASNAQKWSKGSEITIVATANSGYVLDNTPFTVTAGATLKEGNTYTVTGDVTITINTIELANVIVTKGEGFNTFTVTGEGIIGNVEFDEDGMAMFEVKPNTQITISATPTNEEHIVYAAIGGTKTAFTDNAYTVTVTADGLDITVTAEKAPDKKAFVKLTTSNKDDLLKDGAVILIVYETGSVCFDGSLDKLDANLNNTDVTIKNNQIEYTDDLNKVTFTIESVSNGNIKSASGYYIGTTSQTNSLVTNKTTKYNNTITVDASGVTITSANNCTLKYNNATNTERFRYYKSGQQSIAVYVLTTVA